MMSVTFRRIAVISRAAAIVRFFYLRVVAIHINLVYKICLAANIGVTVKVKLALRLLIINYFCCRDIQESAELATFRNQNNNKKNSKICETKEAFFRHKN